MTKKQKFCTNCGAEIADSKARECGSCGAKIKKPLYKKWWFWVIIVLFLSIVGGATVGTESGEIEVTQAEGQSTTATQNSSSSQKTYEVVDLQTMFDELDENALRAENKYQNKNVQFKGKIANFDSDGMYISIEPVGASEWNFTTILCYITEKEQREQLMNLSKGDVVTVKGRIISIGEVLGYSMNVHEIES